MWVIAVEREIAIVAMLSLVAIELALYYAARSSERARNILSRFKIGVEPGAILLDIGRGVNPRSANRLLKYVLLAASSGSVALSLYLFYSTVLSYIADLLLSIIRRQPTPQSPLVPVIPGITLGFEILPPLLVSIGVGLVVHEFSHLVAAILNNIPVENWGIGIFLIFPIAYVRVEETTFSRSSLMVKASVLGAGVLANLAVGLLSLIVLGALTQPLVSMLDGPHMVIVGVDPEMPAGRSGMKYPAILLEINDSRIQSLDELRGILNKSLEGRTVFRVRVIPVETSVCGYYKKLSKYEEYLVVRESEDVKRYGYRIGVVVVPEAYVFSNATSSFLLYAECQFRFLYIVNVSLAIVNSAPIIITDGGKILTEIFKKFKAQKVDKVVQWSTIVITALTVFMGLWRSLFG